MVAQQELAHHGRRELRRSAEAAVRRGDTARDVDFWRRIETEVDQRRRMKTPAYVQDRIMQALPQATPRVITPFWRRQFAVTPTMWAYGALIFI